MLKRVIYTNPDGSVSIVLPWDHTVEYIVANTVPKNATNVAIVESREIPGDRSYRNAWNIVGKKIGHDMVKAREIHREKLRVLRAPKLAELDVEYQKADEAGNNQLKKDIAAKKEKLRNITANPEIEAATTIEELKVAGLGDLV